MSTRVRLDLTMAQAKALRDFAAEGEVDNEARLANHQFDMPHASHEAGIRAIDKLRDAIARANERHASKTG